MIRLSVLAIFLVLLGEGTSAPVIRNWSLAEVDAAVSDPDNAPDELISLVDQIKEGVYPSFVENNLFKSPSGNDKWTVEELGHTIRNLEKESSDRYPEYRNALEIAHIFAIWNKKDSVYVRSPSQWIQTWTMSDMNQYLEKSEFPNRPFVKDVRDHRNMLQEAVKNGKKWNTIAMMTIPDYYYDTIPSQELYEMP